ncbi:MAG: GIY-YIG nuclease family protein [Alteraurantiacibacter sp.]
MASLTKTGIPQDAGVYALYLRDQRQYVGKAKSLQQRIWNNHCGRGAVMTGSALRRNIAEHLGIATAADIKTRRYQPTAQEVATIRSWLEECEIAWLTCASELAAVALESNLKAEFQPPLTKS